MALSRAILATVEPGSQESDYALLNLATLHLQGGSLENSKSHATRLQETTSNEVLRLIGEGTALMLAAAQAGSIPDVSRHLELMASRQRGVHPHFYGVTMLNLAESQILGDAPASALVSSNEAIEALEGTSSRMELSAALAARAMALTLAGRADEARATVQRASVIDERETILDRADLLDSFLDPDASKSILDSLAERSEAHAQLLFNLQSAWYFGRRGRNEEAQATAARLDAHSVFVNQGQATFCLVTSAYVAVASGSARGPELVLRHAGRRRAGCRAVVARRQTPQVLLRKCVRIRLDNQGRWRLVPLGT